MSRLCNQLDCGTIVDDAYAYCAIHEPRICMEHGQRDCARCARADNINHPPHYTHGGIETIDVIEAWELSFCLGSVIEYISRANHKGSRLDDLRKAAWYLKREIKRLEK